MATVDFNVPLPTFHPFLKRFSEFGRISGRRQEDSSFVENASFLNCSFNFGNNQKSQEGKFGLIR